MADLSPSSLFDADMPRDERTLGLAHWAAEIFADETAPRISVASADASFRRYFRVRSGERTWIIMDAPPDKEDVRPFISIAQALVAMGVNAPVIHRQNLAEGYLLLSDLGNRTYLTEFANETVVDALYTDALAALVRIQARGGSDAERLPAYDAVLLERELGLFPEWFMGRHLGISLTATERADLAATFERLTASALEQPQVFVHRDYHSRNLMVGLPDQQPGRPGILDFQDAVKGPITYDLVSLLRDCYVAWPQARVAGWLRQYRNLATDAGLEMGEDEIRFRRWFDFMGAQRHLKVAGIFSRLWHRDNKAGYLKDIPRTLDYLVLVSRQYPELQSLAALLDGKILPAMRATAAPATTE